MKEVPVFTLLYHMDVPDLENLTFSIPIFRISHPSVYHFRKKSTNFAKIGCNNMLKIHPICVIRAPPSLMKTHRSLYQISRKCAPKGKHIIIRIPYPCETSPKFIYVIYGSQIVTLSGDQKEDESPVLQSLLSTTNFRKYNRTSKFFFLFLFQHLTFTV